MESTSVYWKPVFNLLEGELRGSLGQCAPHEGRAGLEDRCEGLHGSRTSSRMGSSEASSRRHRSATCAISRDIGRASSGIGSRPPTVCTSCWRRPTSSSRTWSQTCWASRAVPCWTRLSPEKPIWSAWRSWRRAASPESSDLFQEFIKRKPITGTVGPADIAMANDPAQWNVVTLA